jgi:acetylornithine deacetylase/succinyl-diaminopimelate desuccinylase-like protein
VIPVAASELLDEAVALLQRLIRLNTVSPPGNETPAAELLRDYLAGAGVDCGMYAKDPARANLVARIPGRGEGPSLLFLGHTDTVLADAVRWSVDPWSGKVRDGEVWGRGALDMKGQVAAEAMVMAALGRAGFRPAGDLVFAAVSDEEVGDGHGIEWLCEAHPELVRTDYAINEGGGVRVIDGRAFYACATGEKRQTPFRLTVLGRSGHGSRPALADNALVRAARVIERVSELTATPAIQPETARALAGIVPGVSPEEALNRLRTVDPELAAGYDALLGFTVAPTVVSGSTRVNVIPGRVEVLCDCRLLPGQSEAEMEAVVRDHLTPFEFELEWIGGRGGSRSSVDTPLYAALEEFVLRDEPGSALVPALGGGFTDSHYVREAFGTIAYGFLPLRALDPSLHLAHGEDERVPVADLELWLRLLLHLAAADLA